MSTLTIALKFRVEYALFRLAETILGALSVERASGLSGWIWRSVAPRLHRHDRALKHLALAFPHKTPAERESIALGMWDNLGRTFAEAFHLRHIVASGRIHLENPDVFERWAAGGGGKIACTGHFANWELAVAKLTEHGMQPWSLSQRIKNPLVGRRIADLRGFLYTGGLLEKGPTVPRIYMRVFRAGGTIGFLADLCEPGGVEVPFFGRPAPSTTFPAVLARSGEAPVLIAHMRRLPGVRFVQSCELIETPVTADRKADIHQMTVMIHAALERYIRTAPDQWMWAHRRWGSDGALADPRQVEHGRELADNGRGRAPRGPRLARARRVFGRTLSLVQIRNRGR